MAKDEGFETAKSAAPGKTKGGNVQKAQATVSGTISFGTPMAAINVGYIAPDVVDTTVNWNGTGVYPTQTNQDPHNIPVNYVNGQSYLVAIVLTSSDQSTATYRANVTAVTGQNVGFTASKI